MIKYLIKFIISTGLIVFLIFKLDWHQISLAFFQAKFTYLFIAILLFFIERILAAYRWDILLKSKKIRLPFLKIFSISYIGNFFGIFLPSSLSIDVVRGFYIKKVIGDYKIAFSSIMIDRVIGLTTLIIMAVFSLIFLGITNGLTRYFYISLIVILGLSVLIFSVFSKPVYTFIQNRLLPEENRIVERIINIHHYFLEYKKNKIVLIYSAFLSLLVHLVRIFYFYICALAFDVKAPFIYFLVFIPVVMILIQLPFSFSGIGIREGALVGFFSLFGLPAAGAFLTSFSVSILTTLTSAVGGIFYLFYKTDNIDVYDASSG